MNYIYKDGELYHYGVKGMKWGVRKGTDDISVKKSAYKNAKKEYNKSFNKAYNKAVAAYSPFKKHRRANDERWNDVAEKAEKLRNTKRDYKAAVKAEKTAYKDFVKTRSKEILAGESFVGKMYDKLTGAHKYAAELEYNLRKYKD